jgi:PRTRC genetic system ThiF family protein
MDRSSPLEYEFCLDGALHIFKVKGEHGADREIIFSGTLDNLSMSHFSGGVLDYFKKEEILPTLNTPGAYVDPGPIHEYLSDHNAPVRILIVGAGGTGGYFVRDLARYVYSLQLRNPERSYQILLMDGDKVEEKNLIRQNFIHKDVGEYKAEVLARRYSGHFGVDIVPITEMYNINDNSSLRGLSEISIVINCGDNNNLRRSLCRDFSNSTFESRFYLDAGNEKTSGQVVMGYKSHSGPYNYTMDRTLSNFIHNDYQDFYSAKESLEIQLSTYMDDFSAIPFTFPVDILYPEIGYSHQDRQEELSCAEAAEREDQTIFINMLSSNYLMNYMRKILSGQKIMSCATEFSLDGGAKNTIINKNVFMDILKNFREKKNEYQKGGTEWRSAI